MENKTKQGGGKQDRRAIEVYIEIYIFIQFPIANLPLCVG